MSIDQATIVRISHLARLEITPDETALFQNSLNSIFDWITQLDEIDTSLVEPLFSVHLDHMPQRDDIVSDGNYVDDIMLNAPDKALNMFAVPKVIE